MFRIRTALGRPRPPLLLAAALLIPVPLVAAQVARVVPDDAFLISHTVADEGMAFVDEYASEVLQAVRDAGFDELLLDIIESGGLPAEEMAQIRMLRRYLWAHIDAVDWEALGAHESVFAMDMRPMVPWIPGALPSIIMGFRPDPAAVPGLEKSLSQLLKFFSQITQDQILYEKIDREVQGSTVYNLRVRAWSDLPIVQIAFHGGEILFAAGESFFESALARLEDTSGTSLVDTERYAMAFGELDRAAPRKTFIDVDKLLDDAQEQVLPFIGDSFTNTMERDLAREMFDLAHVVDTVAMTAHAEGHTVVAEHWVRFDQRAVDEGNPIYLAMCKPADNDLMDYVPADATSFSMSKGVDLVPLYRYARDRYKHYAPYEAEQVLVALDTAQAAFGLDVEEDILSLFASDSITIQLPAARPNAMQPEDYVVLVDLRNPEGTKELVKRFEGVYAACVPWLVEELEKREPDAIFPTFTLEDADGLFPGMKHFAMHMKLPFMAVPMPSMTYGILGDKLVMTSSQEALAVCFEAAAGEVDGIADHPAMAGGERLPDGPLAYATLIPYGRRFQEMLAGFQMATTGLSMGLDAATRHNGKAEVQAMVKTVSGIMPRIAGILSHIDFLEDGVTYAQHRHVGSPALYARTTTRYRSPAER